MGCGSNLTSGTVPISVADDQKPGLSPRATAVLRILLLFSPVLLLGAHAPAVQKVERGNLVLDGIPETPADLTENLKRYSHFRPTTFLDWTPEGGMLVSTRAGDVEQVHYVKQPLGMLQQLTFSEDPVSSAHFAPGSARHGFIFTKDADGNENTQIYYFPFGNHAMQSASGPEGGARLVTDGRSLNGHAVWANSGQRVAFYSNARDGVSYDVYSADPESSEPPKLVVEATDNTWCPLDWSPDDHKLLLLNFATISDAEVYVQDLDSGVRTQVDPSRDIVGVDTAFFSRDGQGVYLVSDRDSEFRQLRYFDLKSGATSVLTQEIPWDIEGLALSPDGRYLAYVANIEGLSRLTLLDLREHTDLVGPRLPQGRIINVQFDPNSSWLAFSFESARVPRDAYAWSLAERRLVRWTDSEAGPVDMSRFVDAELMHFPTFDRKEGPYTGWVNDTRIKAAPRDIPAFIYRPKNAARRAPVLINIHGGPESQYRPGFDPFLQFVVNELGYVVIAPNVRGSNGYGKDYLRLDNGYLRENAVKDIGALIDWVRAQTDLDAHRIVTMGASYGGYMTLASLTNFSRKLSGGIDVVGISNYVTFLESTADYRRDNRRAEYGDERDAQMREFLTRISPLYNADRIKRPLLVVQGLNDPRVAASESEQLVARVRANGGAVWYLMARDEGHGFRKKQNRDVFQQTVADFLLRLANDEEIAAR